MKKITISNGVSRPFKVGDSVTIKCSKKNIELCGVKFIITEINSGMLTLQHPISKEFIRRPIIAIMETVETRNNFETRIATKANSITNLKQRQPFVNVGDVICFPPSKHGFMVFEAKNGQPLVLQNGMITDDCEVASVSKNLPVNWYSKQYKIVLGVEDILKGNSEIYGLNN